MSPLLNHALWQRRLTKTMLSLLLGLLVGLAIGDVTAQDTPRAVSFDEVNAVAARMYCPECENIPLDKCFTSVCIQWKQEIAQQLAEGQSPDAIVRGFVARFGDQVVGVPQDPFLRGLALWIPPALLVLCVLVGVWVIRSKRTPPAPAPEATTTGARDDKWIARLEEDLNRE
jgi:cytochrome c-type biogenesis protein CcmH/NrfF